MLGEAEQLRGQLAGGLPAQLLQGLWSVRDTARRACLYPRFLALNPGSLLLGKQLGVAAGAPPRKGNADASVRTNPNYIPSCPGMTDEFHETITIVLRHGS